MATAIPKLVLECKVCKKALALELVTVRGFHYHPECATTPQSRCTPDICAMVPSEPLPPLQTCFCLKGAHTAMHLHSQMFSMWGLQEANLPQLRFHASRGSLDWPAGKLVRIS